jgi:hypothetical protein
MFISPIGVKKQISQELIRLLWQGGNLKSKRYHLVNWSTIRAPKSHDGIIIKEPSLMNLAMGTKLVWLLVTKSYDWWRTIIHTKYFWGERKICLHVILVVREGSPIWKLINATIPIIQEKIDLVLGNKHSIDLWQDNIIE